MAHLALAVHDQARSRCFYETYFGFDAGPARVAEDGVLLLSNADGLSLALGRGCAGSTGRVTATSTCW
jgi:catechol 2,3-dioxygenase-like lactoylglutathione lyase family enzyme